jgi:hypothetical protein
MECQAAAEHLRTGSGIETITVRTNEPLHEQPTFLRLHVAALATTADQNRKRVAQPAGR